LFLTPCPTMSIWFLLRNWNNGKHPPLTKIIWFLNHHQKYQVQIPKSISYFVTWETVQYHPIIIWMNLGRYPNRPDVNQINNRMARVRSFPIEMSISETVILSTGNKSLFVIYTSWQLLKRSIGNHTCDLRDAHGLGRGDSKRCTRTMLHSKCRSFRSLRRYSQKFRRLVFQRISDQGLTFIPVLHVWCMNTLSRVGRWLSDLANDSGDNTRYGT
jgi:hypothetical protein